jgi:serine/threonine-protein kinase RsbW
VQGDISVTLPARSEFVHVLRSVVAAIAARLDFSVDDIDDLRLVVDEACGQLLALPGSAKVLRLKLVPAPGSLELLVSTDGSYSWPPRGQNALAWEILSALSDESEFEQRNGPTIKLGKRVRRVG